MAENSGMTGNVPTMISGPQYPEDLVREDKGEEVNETEDWVSVSDEEFEEFEESNREEDSVEDLVETDEVKEDEKTQEVSK